LFFENGDIVLCAFISPYARDRARVRALFPEGRFLEIFVDCPLEECERRDPKKLYARARTGAVTRMTGVADPYEVPVTPDFVARTAVERSEEIVSAIIDRLRAMHILIGARWGLER
jgi:adenylylsulfate kinase